MSDDAKAQRIEQAIAALEKTGPTWTNQMVYAHTGGNYTELSQYLKARRAGEVGPHRQPPEPVTPEVLHQQFLDERARLEALIREVEGDVHRLATLVEARATLAVVEERLPGLAQEAEAYAVQQRRAHVIATCVPKWAEAAQRKTDALAAMQRLAGDLWGQVKAYEQAHGTQVHCATQTCSREFAQAYQQMMAHLAQVLGAVFHPTQAPWGREQLAKFDDVGRKAELPLYY